MDGGGHHTQVDEVVEEEPGLTDMQRIMLRASAYDSYDMLVLTDEFVNQVGHAGLGWHTS